MTDRDTLAHWEEARALDAEAMAFARVTGRWLPSGDGVAVTVWVTPGHYAYLRAAMEQARWIPQALGLELDHAASDIKAAHDCALLGLPEAIGEQASPEPAPASAGMIDEDDIPF